MSSSSSLPSRLPSLGVSGKDRMPSRLPPRSPRQSSPRHEVPVVDTRDDDSVSVKSMTHAIQRRYKRRSPRRAVPAVDTRVVEQIKSRETGAQHRVAFPSVQENHNRRHSDALSVSSSSSSQLSQIPVDNMAYWSSLSVRAAITVIEAKGSEIVAKKVANAVLDAGKKKCPITTATLRTLATQVSLLVLGAGGDHTVAAAAVVTIMSGGENQNEEGDAAAGKEIKIRQNINRSMSSAPAETPSMIVARRQLKAREDELADKMRALEIAELMNLEKEKQINQRMEALDSAKAEMREKVDYMQTEIDEKLRVAKEKEEGIGFHIIRGWNLARLEAQAKLEADAKLDTEAKLEKKRCDDLLRKDDKEEEGNEKEHEDKEDEPSTPATTFNLKCYFCGG